MKTFLITLLALTASSRSETARHRRDFTTDYSGFNQLSLSNGGELTGYEQSAALPLQETDLYSSGIAKYLSIPDYGGTNDADFGLKVTLPLAKAQSIAIPAASSNSIEKPVEEPQEYVPPQSIGTAILPQMPPPATPVNAAAANVPSQRGAVFLGSGALGVVALGHGQYALGSGSLGYSQDRRQPRPSFKVPLYPPLPASPDLIPAAVPSQQTPPQPIPYPVIQPAIDSSIKRPVDANGYEYLPPNEVRFGFRNPRPFRLKTTQAFATPTQQIPQPPPPLPQQQPISRTPIPFAQQRVPNLYALQTGY